MIPLGKLVVHLITTQPEATVERLLGPATFTAGPFKGTMTLERHGSAFKAVWGFDALLRAKDAKLYPIDDMETAIPELAVILGGGARIFVAVPNLPAQVPGTIIEAQLELPGDPGADSGDTSTSDVQDSG